MRILIVSDLLPPAAHGGYERQCAALAAGLAERHDVSVLTSDLGRDAISHEAGVHRALPYVDVGRAESLRAPVAALRAARTARRVLDAVDPELVYLSNAVAIPQAAVLAILERELPLVYRLSEWWYAQTLHTGDRYLRHLLPGDRGVRRAWGAARRAANLLPGLGVEPSRPIRAAISWCSDDLRSRARLPPTVEPVLERTIHPGNATGEAFSSLVRDPDPQVTIAYAGRVTTAKGAEVAVRAVAALGRRHGIEARLLMAGSYEPDMGRAVRRLATGLGVGDRVQLLGALDTPALGALLARARAVVIPSVEPEAFGNVCIEAGLARVPIVASRVGGIPEALREGTDALFFAAADHDGCADALARVLTDPDGAAERVRNAFAGVRRFSLERYVTASEELVLEAAERLGAQDRPRPAARRS